MMEVMHDVAYELDFVTSGLKWSDELYTVYGYDRTVPANTVEWWTGHIHPDDAMILNQAMDKLEDPEAAEWMVEYRFRKADNNYVLVEDRAKVVRDAVGKPVRLTGILRQKQP